MGNKNLLEALRRIKPRYHVFGHVHEAYGVYENKIEDFDITLINASGIMAARLNSIFSLKV